jgi:hypothetical protein
LEVVRHVDRVKAGRGILMSMRRRAVAILTLAVLIVPATRGAASDRKAPPPFRATVSRIDAQTRELMIGRSWRKGCPVPLWKLRVIRLRHWGFDRAAHWGRLVVHREVASKIVDVFRTLYEERYPIRRMWLVDRYGADDLKSMKHDNTSAFNCRWAAGHPGVWSQHAYGRALDINPVENPYVSGTYVSPPRGRRYADRSQHRKGMIHRGDKTVRAFRSVGWKWAGAWTGSVVDYQHFSANGH